MVRHINDARESALAQDAHGAIEIRSYRHVFAIERRLYRIDTLRLNPAGVPLRGIAYCFALLCTALVASRLPILGGVIELVPWYVRYVGAPALCAAALTVVRVEGRPFHLAVLALLRYRLDPRRLAGVRRAAPSGARWCSGNASARS